MEFTRHARNEMRLYSIDRTEVEAVIAAPLETRSEGQGKLRLIGEVGGRAIVVVIAGDDPNLVITTFERS
jgi:hypothetical protein